MLIFNRSNLLALCIICAFLTTHSIAFSNDWSGNINAFMGTKYLDKDEWEPVEEQQEFALMCDIKHRSWPVSIALNLLQSNDKSTRFLFYSWDTYYYIYGLGYYEGKTNEINLGFRKIWDIYDWKFHPFFGAGVAYIKAEAVVSARAFPDSLNPSGYLWPQYTVKDDSYGTWFGAGGYWTIGEYINVGVNFRWSQADVDMTRSQLSRLMPELGESAGGRHAGVFLGYHW